MTVQEIMAKSPVYCDRGMNLAQATELLWKAGCGALPVVGPWLRVVGIITDRDICIALGTRNLRPSEVTVGEAMSSHVVMCAPCDDIHAALDKMRRQKVRRLPVVNRDGTLQGMLCASDILLYARHDDGTSPELSYENIVGALRGIYWRCPAGEVHCPN
ncbi:MAG: CBS domain-containing protein [Bryobacteraceae bacterium]|jgi:CBS domain-containing protein